MQTGKASSNGNSIVEGGGADELKEDFDRLRKDFAALRDDLMKIGSNQAAAASEKLESTVDRARDRAAQFISAADEEAHAAAGAVQKTVRETPLRWRMRSRLR